MPVQTTYDIYTSNAYAGQLADLHDSEVVSRLAEGGDIPFGVAVGEGTNDAQCVIGGAEFLGVAVRDLARPGAYDGAATVKYLETQAVSVLRRGYVSAKAPAGAAKGDAVKYNTTTGVLGAGAAGAGEAIIPGATWQGTVQANKIGVIRLSGQIATLVS